MQDLNVIWIKQINKRTFSLNSTSKYSKYAIRGAIEYKNIRLPNVFLVEHVAANMTCVNVFHLGPRPNIL